MDLFLYGTLQKQEVLEALAGPGGQVLRPALLDGHRVARVEGHDLPMLVARQGGRVEGLLCTGLRHDQRARIDAYEAAFDYVPRPVVVTCEGTSLPALAYFPPADLAPASDPWSLAQWDGAAGATNLLAVAELGAHHPPLCAAEIARQWPMIEKRAFARHRAATAPPPPASLRRAADPGDTAVTAPAPLQGRFFKLAAYAVDHRTFGGAMSGPLQRETFLGVDAALVLPYDAARDRLLLVEQFRTGPLMRHDPNPWCLEPVAGMVDARETPAACALRETAEEAGLHLRGVEPMFGVYASPGSATDFFHCFLGRCDLPDTRVRTGGLAAEHEDLRLHVLSFDAALALLDSGEINVAPLAAMLLWLARHRDRLRAEVKGGA